MSPVGRPAKCGSCGKCDRCKRAAYMRKWWASRTPAQKRAAIAARDPDLVREQDRRKMQKRRTQGTPEQKLRIAVRSEVRKALQRGDLVRGPCVFAGPDCHGRVEAHHVDLSEPLNVYWLCRKHHRDQHDT